MKFHKSVLLNEVESFLSPAPGKVFIDATLGEAGHAKVLLDIGSRVLGIDRDEESVDYVRSLELKNFKLALGNFAQIGEIAKREGFDNVDGILYDLGVSSRQLDQAQRGFSFQKSGPLDMRMDRTISITARDLINNFSERRLDEIFKTYGQEKFSRRIASFICRAREVRAIRTTDELSAIVKEAIPRGVAGKNKINEATKVFQALRIVVNSELLNLEESLPQTVSLLKSGGRLVIISFHSLEDAIVKRFFKQENNLKILTKKPIGPQAEEVKDNPRSRSAKLRVAERI